MSSSTVGHSTLLTRLPKHISWCALRLHWLRRLVPLLWLLCLAPFLHTFWLAETYSVNAPLNDDWQLVGEGLARYHEGTLGWDFFWSPYVSSRSPIPRAYLVGMGILTGWDVKVGIRTTLVLTFASLLAIVYLVRRQGLLDVPEQAIFAAICSCLLFNPYQQTQWLLNCFPANLMGLTPVVWAFVLWNAGLKMHWKLTLGIFLAVFASFSFVTGMLIWVIMVPLVLLYSPPNFMKRLQPAAIWLAAFGTTLALYLHGGFQPGQRSISISEAVIRWPEVVKFVLTFLGGPVSFFPDTDQYLVAPLVASVFLVGLVLILGIGWRFFTSQEGMRLALPWLCCIVLAGGIATMMSLGRLDHPDAVLLNRYQMYSCWFYIGWLGIARLSLSRIAQGYSERITRRVQPSGSKLVVVPGERGQVHPLRFRRVWLLLALIIPLLGLGGLATQKAYVEGIRKMPFRHYDTVVVCAATQFLKVCPDDELLTTLVWGDPGIVYRTAPILDAAGFLHPGLLKHPEMARNTIVEPQDTLKRYEGKVLKAERRANGEFMASGWAIERKSKAPAPLVVLSAQTPGAEERILGYNVKRVRDKEISKQFKGKVLNGRYGWEVAVRADRMPREEFRLRAYAFDNKTQEFHRLPGEIDVAALDPGMLPTLSPSAPVIKPEFPFRAPSSPVQPPSTGQM